MQQPTHDLRPFQTSIASPRRWFSIAVVAVIHVIVIWAFATGLASRLIQRPLEELKAEVVQEKPPEQQKEPPPPPPEMKQPPPPFVPPPDITIQMETPATNAITQVQSQVAKPQISAPASVGRPHSCVNMYPPSAQRLNHEGVTTLEFQITTDGSVTGITVAKSSGFQELDDAAVRCAGNWHYKPAIQNGQPVQVPWKTNVTWNLRG